MTTCKRNPASSDRRGQEKALTRAREHGDQRWAVGRSPEELERDLQCCVLSFHMLRLISELGCTGQIQRRMAEVSDMKLKARTQRVTQSLQSKPISNPSNIFQEILTGP